MYTTAKIHRTHKGLSFLAHDRTAQRARSVTTQNKSTNSETNKQLIPSDNI